VTFKKKYILYIVAIPAVLGLLVYFFNYSPGESGFFLKCPLKHFIGIYCPGCGSQRALHSLLHLEFGKVASLNFLFLPALGVFIYNLFVRIYNHFSQKQLVNYLYKPNFPKVVLAIVIIFWIARNIPIKPFSFLAP